MTSAVALFLGTFPDLTLPAMHKKFLRQAAAALNIFNGKVFTVRKRPFSRHFSLVKLYQPFLKFLIMITVSDINGTDAARRNMGLFWSR
jgi:hypothetical protein